MIWIALRWKVKRTCVFIDDDWMKAIKAEKLERQYYVHDSTSSESMKILTFENKKCAKSLKMSNLNEIKH